MRDVRRSVPAHVDDAVATALEKLPADRFATRRRFRAALAGTGDARTRRPADRAAVREHRQPFSPPLGRHDADCARLGYRATHFSTAAPDRAGHEAAVPGGIARMSTGGVLAISPDGSKIATIEFLPGGLQTHLVVHPLDQSAPTPIVGSEGDCRRSSLQTAHGSGGPPAHVSCAPVSTAGRVARPRASVTDLGATDFVDSGAWTDDGTIVFTSRSGRLYRVNAAGGAAARIASSVDQPGRRKKPPRSAARRQARDRQHREDSRGLRDGRALHRPRRTTGESGNGTRSSVREHGRSGVHHAGRRGHGSAVRREVAAAHRPAGRDAGRASSVLCALAHDRRVGRRNDHLRRRPVRRRRARSRERQRRDDGAASRRGAYRGPRSPRTAGESPSTSSRGAI